MSFASLIREIAVGSDQVRLLMEDQSPAAEFQGQIIHQLWILCQQCNLLTDTAYLKEFAVISNFLWKGTSFQFIDQIEEYQKNYYAQIERENKYPADVFPYRLTDYKIFDLSAMHDPRLIEERLHFYVSNTATGLPYRVICPFPYTSLSTLVHYQILPLKG